VSVTLLLAEICFIVKPHGEKEFIPAVALVTWLVHTLVVYN
jgi:hypothetical protein